MEQMTHQEIQTAQVRTNNQPANRPRHRNETIMQGTSEKASEKVNETRKPRVEVTREEIDRMREYAEQGKSLAEISRITGRCHSVVYRYVNQGHSQSRAQSENKRNTMQELRRQGYTNAEIAGKIGYSEGWVRKVLGRQPQWIINASYRRGAQKRELNRRIRQEAVEQYEKSSDPKKDLPRKTADEKKLDVVKEIMMGVSAQLARLAEILG